MQAMQETILLNSKAGQELIDLSPLWIEQFSTPHFTLRATEPLELIPVLKSQEIVIELPQFGIIATAKTREEAIEALQEDIIWLWLEYTRTPDEQLSRDARELKRELLALFREEYSLCLETR